MNAPATQRSNVKTHHLLSVALTAALLLLCACSDSPLEPSDPAGHGELIFDIDASGTEVTKVQVEVRAADMVPLIAEVPLAADGSANGALSVPAGTDRTVTVSGLGLVPDENFAIELVELHRKVLSIDVIEGMRHTISLVLDARPGRDGGEGGRDQGVVQLEAA